ncbi:MAG: hypothetical protein IH851_11415 [Armatimonadetes bacterium]|nr:hypothetical protein [Armatimonadota bacterium]
MPDCVPQPDSEFDACQNDFAEYVDGNMAAPGLAIGGLDALNAARTACEASCPAHVTAQPAHN